MSLLADVFLHTPKYLDILFTQYRAWTYVILFLIIFMETGLVITPFLPGDSLLFGLGAIAAGSAVVSTPILVLILCAAAVLGDSANYEIGRMLRNVVKNGGKLPLVKMSHIDKTQKYFERYGGKTITIARFIPIVRTFAPFVSGAAQMRYVKFVSYNILGGVAWVFLMFGIGYFFGNLAVVQERFSLIMIMIVMISITPLLLSFLNRWRKK